jgi:hypothetical protein
LIAFGRETVTAADKPRKIDRDGPHLPTDAEDLEDRRIAERALTSYRAGTLDLISSDDLRRSLGLEVKSGGADSGG